MLAHIPGNPKIKSNKKNSDPKDDYTVPSKWQSKIKKSANSFPKKFKKIINNPTFLTKKGRITRYSPSIHFQIKHDHFHKAPHLRNKDSPFLVNFTANYSQTAIKQHPLIISSISSPMISP